MAVNRKLVVLVVLMVSVIEGSRGQNILCKMDEAGLMACKPSVTPPNPVDPPPTDCCKALSEADLDCLCGYRTSPLLPTYGIDPDLAVGLISKCNLKPPANC